MAAERFHPSMFAKKQTKYVCWGCRTEQSTHRPVWNRKYCTACSLSKDTERKASRRKRVT